MMACSAALSTSLTKSAWDFLVMVRWSILSVARWIRLPARRAAFTAMLSMGCMIALGLMSGRKIPVAYFSWNYVLYKQNPLNQVRVVLSHTTHPGNIGAAARAMKTMGLRHLYLITPRHFPDPQADTMSAGAE